MCEGTNKAFADHEALDKKAFEVICISPLHSWPNWWGKKREQRLGSYSRCWT